MKNRSRKLFFTLLLACSVAVMATGCDKLKKEPETEVKIETEPQTEAPTERETESETPVQTEAPTERETESETPAQTEPRILTVEQELAEQTEYGTLRTLYAADNVNVREQPGTDGEIFESFAQGDKIIVIGETPNWYVIELDEYDIKGYVSKEFVSDSEVAPKTEEEIAASAQTGTTAGETVEASSSVNSSVDAEYGVGSYAEPFEIAATAGANIRQTPAADGEIIGVVSSGTVVKVLGYTDRWYKIEYDGTVGYANQNLFATE